MSRKLLKFCPQRYTLAQLVNLVVTCSRAYEDLAEHIENKAYDACIHGRVEPAIKQLVHITSFFENLPCKNEENCRDLADVYILIGEINQYFRCFESSIQWFEKAILVNDRNDIPYHRLASTYLQLNQLRKAIVCLQQEIAVAPGNYYAYLSLADLCVRIKDYQLLELTLEQLLERDPDNIRALHRLIIHYQQRVEGTDVEFLRRRILKANRTLSKMDLVIWTCHMCAAGKLEEAMEHLHIRQQQSPQMTIIHLLKAHIYGKQSQYVKKQRELEEFVDQNHGRPEIINNKLSEFESIFGSLAATRLKRKLVLIRPIHSDAHPPTLSLSGITID